jgi:hypothetical protein
LEQQLNHRAWFEPPSVRLALWREFRKSLDKDNIIDVCDTVIRWWQSAPLVNLTIDPVNAGQWPTPWEMLHHGDFCENSLALGMSYTIYYANPDIENELLFLTCKDSHIQKLCALIDNKHLLNYKLGSISTLPTDNCEINYRIKVKDIVKK